MHRSHAVPGKDSFPCSGVPFTTGITVCIGRLVVNQTPEWHDRSGEFGSVVARPWCYVSSSSHVVVDAEAWSGERPIEWGKSRTDHQCCGASYYDLIRALSDGVVLWFSWKRRVMVYSKMIRCLDQRQEGPFLLPEGYDLAARG